MGVSERQFEDLYARQRPAVRVRGGGQVVPGFGRRDQQTRFVVCAADQQEVQGERRFPGPRAPFNDIDLSARQSAAQDEVEALDPRRRACGRTRRATVVLRWIAMRLSSHVTIPFCAVQ